MRTASFWSLVSFRHGIPAGLVLRLQGSRGLGSRAVASAGGPRRLLSGKAEGAEDEQQDAGLSTCPGHDVTTRRAALSPAFPTTYSSPPSPPSRCSHNGHADLLRERIDGTSGL